MSLLNGKNNNLKSASGFSAWFLTSNGIALLAKEKQLISPICMRLSSLVDAKGQTKVYAGCAESYKLFNDFLAQKFLTLECGANLNTYHLQTKIDQLPLKLESVGLFVLHHIFDEVETDSSVLDEIAKAVAPGGLLLIVDFMPLSYLTLNKVVKVAKKPLSLRLPFSNKNASGFFVKHYDFAILKKGRTRIFEPKPFLSWQHRRKKTPFFLAQSSSYILLQKNTPGLMKILHQKKRSHKPFTLPIAAGYKP